ncbi:MAG: NUDIX domain-containing protein, partial [Burkholderiales bacterium]|nr:NUDIX domain-containing protein [Burkholderiales bacterium]
MRNRHRLEHHFTASGVVLAGDHILLVYHRRIQAWLPPGGHIEDFEMPHEAAVREVFEETGVEVEIVGEPLPETGDPDAFFLKHPLCLHAVRAFEGGRDLYHVDIAYFCVPANRNSASTPVGPAISSNLPDL